MSLLKTKKKKVPKNEPVPANPELPQDPKEDALVRILSEAEAEALLARPGDVGGPLPKLIPVFLDVETKLDESAGLTLKCMTLRQYLMATELESIAVGIGDDEVEIYYTSACGELPPGAKMVDAQLIAALTFCAQNPAYVFVAHNAAFDTRAIRELLDVPYPINVWCTMEGAMGAWPELPGGYGLANVARKQQFPKRFRKLELDLELLSKLRRAVTAQGPIPKEDVYDEFVVQLEEIAKAGKLVWDGVVTVPFLNQILAVYNKRDVVSMRALYKRQIARLPGVEQEVALRTHHQRRHYFEVQQGALDELIVKLQAAAEKTVDTTKGILQEQGLAAELIADMVSNIFNRGERVKVKGVEVIDPLKLGKVTSIRYARLKHIINDPKSRLTTEEFASVSMKKINPVQLARNPAVGITLEQTSRASKMLSHMRRSTVFTGVSTVDAELGYHRAHTGRFSSPAVGGRGLNLHNCVAITSSILSNRGWVSILDLNTEDLLWDGQAFVTFDSVTWEGSRSTIKVGAAELTSEQPVLSRGHRLAASSLTPCQQVQCVAGGLSSTLRGLLALPSESVALAAEKKLCEWWTTSRSRLAAAGVPIDVLLARASQVSTRPPSGSSAADTRTCCIGGITSPTESSQPSPMGPESAKPGSTASRPTSNTSRLSLAGMIEISSWIESTTCEATSPATCASLTASLAAATDAILFDVRQANSSQRIARGSAFRSLRGTLFSKQDVFDIREAGPRHLFTCDGILTFNCPKHDKEIAEPVRKLFKMPKHLCLVRGDLANVEYRIEGLITESPTVIKMFDSALGGNINNDPYCLAWKAMTGVTIAKKDPIRQVAKAAVLGLGFRMSAAGFARVLLKALAAGSADILAAKAKGKPVPDVVTEALLEKIVIESGWLLPEDGSIQYIMKKEGCSQLIAVAAYHIHRLFNESHPEFARIATWLVQVVQDVAAAPAGPAGRDFAQRIIDRAYTWTTAPNRDLIGLEIDDDPLPTYPSVRVRCGPWPRTVIWREPHMRINPFEEERGARLTIRKQNGTFKSFSPQLAIENVTQAAARNAMCMGVAHLDRLGYRDVIHVHDEVMLIVPREREAVLKAREALLTAFGPKHSLPHKWAILIKPDEVSVTESLYESEWDFTPAPKGNDRWGRIERNEATCFADLP